MTTANRCVASPPCRWCRAATSTPTSRRPRRLIDEAAAAGARARAAARVLRPHRRARADKLAVQERDGDGPQQAFLADARRRHRHVRDRRQRADRVRRSGARAQRCSSTVRTARASRATTRSTCSASRTATSTTTRRGRSTPATRRRRFDAPCGRVGLSICYDLRFPELYRALGDLALIVVPAAFTARTGAAHWHLLLRARAIENQCYVLAAAQGGMHPGGRRTYGHSMLVDPWGDVARRAGGRCGHRRRRRRSGADRRRPRKLARIAASDARSAR